MAKSKITMDGNTAAAYAAYAFTDVATIYPITPSSTMAEVMDEWSANGKKNIFGQRVSVVEMQSEAGAAGAFHGSLQGGALTSTFTASQGLLLMIPNMYKIAGELLPGVFHVSARALAAQALSIFGDHQDVMAARQTGCALIASGSVQEVADLAPVAHLVAIKGSLPVIHFFDGFRTSHEIQKVEVLDYSDYEEMLDKDALARFREKALSPEHPVTRGTAQNPDIYFQTKEASNKYYIKLIDYFEEYLHKISEKVGRNYKLFNYHGAADATDILIAMGSVTETIDETVDKLNAEGQKVGVVKVHLFRPFSTKHLLEAIPQTVERICVLDRTKEPGAAGEPLYLDVRNAFFDSDRKVKIIGGRYGLGSKDTTPKHIKAVFNNLAGKQMNGFTVAIDDDVTHLSIPIDEQFSIAHPGTVRCKFWGLGSDGTVGANKQAIKIIGETTDKYVQAYFAYDSKKSGGITVSHLRFGDTPIRSTYLIDEADYIACHNQSYVEEYDVLKGLKKGGTFVLNCVWEPEDVENHISAKMKKYIMENDINFYIVNATKIGEETGLGKRINMVMQTIFFKLANIIPFEEAREELRHSVEKAYGKKGEKIVAMNFEAIDMSVSALVKMDIPDNWKNSVDAEQSHDQVPDFIKNVVFPMNAQEGDNLPISIFNGYEDGTFPCGTAAYEKRGIAIDVPEWNVNNCIQCNQCAFICPHACIRPVLVNADEKAAAPETFETKKAIGKVFEGLEYRIQVSPLDCTGCSNCVDICPSKNKALAMKHIGDLVEKENINWEYAAKSVSYKGDLVEGKTVKDSQFKTPLIEFSGACAGCGETPYIKLVTQLFGDRMVIANATGCSSIWGGSAPATPYTTNHEGKGPAWANSLFEDNAEYGYGMALADKQLRNKLEDDMQALILMDIDQSAKEAFSNWIANKNNSAGSRDAVAKVLKALEGNFGGDAKVLVENIKERKDHLVKRSQWILGGDGWAYDIGYGGLDHVMASGENVNVLVFDTEIYSNTGGQSSKATPAAAIAKFAASGKKTGKKNLGMMMMSYGNVYVAQVAIGADKNHLIKTLLEAEAYDGPSIVIAYSPCISQGIKQGMACSIKNTADAVKAGYWHLYRFNPDLKEEGKNPFTLDSKEPSESFLDFIMNQVRYSALTQLYPEESDRLFDKTEQDAKDRYESYKKLAE
ncbi:pyruvate:ferredoxin (flavodoxin) oxidoreductase [Candidatus Epulonipiscium viviparus]|uniref:pyruvate:ferredoxin (flavodoxin) oxidoreductase n=1 Tax=Candidatus Epulonipiscium viviparus TaxID=420336 RepID=UPI002738101B|nr:pyruvate:ferredoxin (flavodoxin) oxidoreductase [Candidatus Epulopiscium viviparus]